QVDETYSHAKYRQFDYLSEELPDVLAATDFVLTRGGSNSIFEFLALNIPMLIIPLPKSQSRGDQILNAKVFNKQGFAYMLEEENLSKDSLLKQIAHLQEKKDEIKKAMAQFPGGNGIDI